MVVALQKECMYLLKDVEAWGHKAVVFGEYFGKIDALLYLSMPAFNMMREVTNKNGILMINVLAKTPEEILEILTRRCYSPIFD